MEEGLQADESSREQDAMIGNGPESPEAYCTQQDRSTWLLGVTLAAAYSLNYFWRYPIFILPGGKGELLDQHVLTVFGTDLNLQACFSMTFVLAFGIAKIPAIAVMSSPFFFEHRFQCMCALFILTMVSECAGVWVFESTPALQIVCVFISCFFASWVYGGLITYMEGRQKTETLLAVLSGFFIYAGNIARGTASLVLKTGIEPVLMPLAIGTVSCPLACFLLCRVNKMPGPSASDIAMRSKRQPMTSQQKWAFVREWSVGIAAMLVSYAIMTGVRSFRDFYAKQIFAAAMQRAVDDVPSYIFFVVDIPGAMLACVALILVNRVTDNRRAIKVLFTAQIGSVVLAIATTILFKIGVLNGVLWQMLLGVGIYVSYSLMQTPVFDRLFAATKTEGTCTFLIFLSDMCGYILTVALLLYQNFGPLGDSSPDTVLQLYIGVLCVGCTLIAVLLWLGMVYFARRLEVHHAGGMILDASTAKDDVADEESERLTNKAQYQD